MATSLAHQPEQACRESELVNQLLIDPSRANFLRLADYCETNERAEDAREFSLGIVPPDFLQRYKLERQPVTAVNQAAGHQRRLEYREELYRVNRPLNDDAQRNSVFDIQSIRTCLSAMDEFHDASLVTNGTENLLIDNSGQYIGQHTTRNYCLLDQHPQRTDTPQQHLSGLTVALLPRNAHNFYHWMVDVITQLELLESSGVALTDVDQFVISCTGNEFQLTSLNMIGIPLERVIRNDKSFSSYRCDRLLLPLQFNRMGRSLSIRSLAFLRRKMLPLQCPVASIGKRIAIHRNARGIANISQVNEQLADFGFDIVTLENLSLPEQISVFHNADVVFAPHGAGLANLTYCRPGTRVLEVYGLQIQPCFWLMSELLGLKYHNYNFSENTVLAESDNNRNLEKRLQSEISVDLSILQKLLSDTVPGAR